LGPSAGGETQRPWYDVLHRSSAECRHADVRADGLRRERAVL